MSGATEMEQREIEQQLRKELQLITGAQFIEAANTFRRIEFGHRPSAPDFTTLQFHITVQPLFHKNFDLLTKSFEDYLLQGYQIYILADSQKQNERLKDIFAEMAKDIVFTPVTKALLTMISVSVSSPIIRSSTVSISTT